MKQMKFLSLVRPLCTVLLITMSLWSFGQQTITGKVVDDDLSPLPGATVRVKGEARGTVTDILGFFSIEQVEAGQILEVSFVGYLTAEVVVGKQDSYEIPLRLDVQTLSEVVVVGYGTVEKSDLTGAVASVDVDEAKKIASLDVSRNIQGKVAGVQVTTNSGAPGQGTNIRIRGIGSFSNANPLFVVDGFLTGDISNINPADIATMEVLKDASATAIYGSRGSNGVIIITTKKGSKNGFEIEFNAFAGVQQAWNQLDLLNSAEYAELYVESVSGPGEDWSINEVEVQDFRSWIREGLSGESATDWQDEVLRVAPIQSYNISVRGGVDKLRYKVTGTYFDQQGIADNTYGKSYQGQVDLSYNILPSLTLGANVKYSFNENINYDQGPYSSILATAVRKDPINPVTAASGDWDRTGLVDIVNPARLAYEQQFETSKTDRVQPTLSLRYEVLPGLEFSSSVMYDERNNDYQHITPPNTTIQSKVLGTDGQPTVSPNESFNDRVTYQSTWQGVVLQNTNTVSYTKKFGDHSLNTVAGFENYQEETTFNSQQSSENSSATDVFDPVARRYTLLSYFARVVYSFNHKYLVTGTIRRDGSSKFPEGDRWGTFPSFSLGWNIDEEGFLQGNEVLTGLKLRGGWGQIGNQGPIAPYAFRSVLSPGWSYPFDNLTPAEGFASTQLAATSITWESSEMSNIGIDADLFQGKLSFVGDFYVKHTNDLLVDASFMPTPTFSGARAPSSNAASMRNTGFEFSTQFQSAIGDVKFSLGGNISFVQNEVTELGAGERIEGANVEPKIGMPVTRTVVGGEFGAFYGLRTLGLFQTTDEVRAHRANNTAGQPVDLDGNVVDEFSDNHRIIQTRAQPGDIRFDDVNGDGIIDAKDAVYLGSPIPDFTYGFFLNAAYQQFDFSVAFTGVYGNEIANVFAFYYRGTNPGENNLARSRLGRWTGEGTSTTEPRVTDNQTQNDLFSDRYIEDGSFLRLRNIQIGYSFPQDLAQKVKASSFRVYLSADNLFTFTQYTGFDPEIGLAFGDPFASGVDIGSYPLARTMIIGTNITF